MTPKLFTAWLAAASISAANPCDDLWNHAILYQNQENPILQEFALQGRLHLQYAAGSSDQGSVSSGDLQDIGTNTWEDIDVRRWYMGFKSTLFQKLKLQGHIIVNPDWGPVYGGLFDFYGTWTVNDQLQLNAGKLEVHFSKDYEISSRELLTIERSLLANQLSPQQLTGAWINGRNVAGGWNYELGVYASDAQDEFTEFAGGATLLGKIGYDLAPATGLEKAAVGFHWLHHTDPGSMGAKPYGDSFSLTGEMKQGRWSATSDLIFATGDQVSDVWGIRVTPAFNITDRLQAVARYQFAGSPDDNGLSLQRRYERTAPDLTGISGDRYQAAYLGLNYYLYGHKLKLMTGVEYAHMRDDANDGGEFDGWTWTTALRLYF